MKASLETEPNNYLEKTSQIAKELVSYGAQAVILSGSAARGKEKPNDLDFLIFGNLEASDEFLETLNERYGIPVQLFAFGEDYVDGLIRRYKTNKDYLSVQLLMMAKDFSGRHLGWPLIPLLSDEEFQDLFKHFLLPGQTWHPYLTREYIVLEGLAYIEAKREELHRGQEGLINKRVSLPFRLLGRLTRKPREQPKT